ncbi:MAG: HAMP domain-containing histidine kinase [Thiocapsa sp.]|uniref:sensor histidine kinase n=1 Tax=Thiocapsa sp. TaxID=2024551 RepID=UPI001BCF1328|nr:HAMP domain-containing sensor histidine kinase [Thiocapsa sp.]QVL48491.1 MAG: HAMP domain-containing histidine kinase [Thiocapsa sp.]
MTRHRRFDLRFSLLQLVLIGFAVVTLPLGLALATAWVAVDHLASKGQDAVVAAVRATRASRNLIEEITDVERLARQYHVLSDPAFLESYETQRESFLARLADIAGLEMGPSVRAQALQLEAASKATFAALDNGETSAEAKKTALENFVHLDELSRNIYRESVRVVAQEVEAMQLQGSDTRQRLLWQASASIPAALLLTFIFTMLIARPMRQLDQAIRSLGDGRFDRPIQVSGLSDLADLGQRLNWLRLRLIELEEQKTFFLHHISHELKTPLTNIVEGAELLSQNHLGPLKPEQNEILDIVRVNSFQLRGLIENLLTASSGADAAAVTAPRRIDLNDLIRKITDRHKLPARAKEIDLELILSGETLWSDKERLGTILDNLLSNAIKFTAARSRVHIVTGHIKNDVYIEVRDEGKGIRPEDHENVFERFFQTPSAVNSRIRGSGLGLFIAREYARALGGRLQVINSDKGACLRLRLPRRRSYRASEAVNSAKTSSQST